MKKLLLTLAMLIVATTLFAAAQTELRVLGNWTEEDWEWLETEFAAEYPEVSLKLLTIDFSDGSTLTMDAQIKAGTPPDVYADYMGRVSKYITPEFALPLEIPDAAKFVPGALASTTRGGQILGLPLPGGAQGMCINLTILEAIGAADFDFDGWTIEQFLVAGDKVKAEYGDEKYLTYQFAGNQSGDYLWMNWLASFGAEMYADGYDSTSVADTGGVKAFEFWLYLQENGYAPDNAETLTDDDYAAAWGRGDVLATPFFTGWTAPYQNIAKEQGFESFDFKFVAFPSATGKAVPAAYSIPGVVVAGATGLPDAATAFARLLVSPEFQARQVATGLVPNRSDVSAPFPDEHAEAIAGIVAAGGLFDLGITSPAFAEIRAQGYPELQKMFTGKQTPAQAIASYVENVNAILTR